MVGGHEAKETSVGEQQSTTEVRRDGIREAQTERNMD